MRLSEYKSIIGFDVEKGESFGVLFFNKYVLMPFVGRTTGKVHWQITRNTPQLVQLAFLKHAEGVFVDYGNALNPEEPLSLKDFVEQYARNGEMTLDEYFQHFVPAPDVTSDYGWATVSRKGLNLRCHYDLYVGDPELVKK
ncbi:hypothetical protein [Klebsiella phage YC1]|nr:hypothetical protein [Klebsiella phage YC1]